uniref:Ig-like domain-containing protein n=1 Tax=Sinocyclocheilus anshuiensis TaxID=1608454 RepID=A0A671NY94_9TELE
GKLASDITPPLTFKLNHKSILLACFKRYVALFSFAFHVPSAFSCMLPAPPPDARATVYLTVPTKMELDNETATFMCLAQRFSPKTYTFKWSLDGKEVTKAIDKCDKSEKKGSVTEYSATSILQISADDWKKPNSMFSLENCECFENRNVYCFSVSLFILCLCLPKSVCFLYPVPFQDCSDIAVDIVAPSLEAMLKNREGVLKCKASADNSGFTKITITANNNDIAEKPVEGNDKHVELDAPIGYEEWSNGTEFTCTVEHNELAEPKSTKFKPTVFILAPPEHKPGEPMTLTCYVKDFYPKEVFVSWLADDEPVTSKYSTSLPIQKDQIFSVYSQLTVNDSKWKNGTVFSCVVYHEGIDEKMRVLTRSIDDNTDKAGVINLSMNTPASCKD